MVTLCLLSLLGCSGEAPGGASGGASFEAFEPKAAARHREVCNERSAPRSEADLREAVNGILIEPRAVQIQRWRPLAFCAEGPLRMEALRQLAWLGDPEGARLAAFALGHREHAVRATSGQVLAHYGSPAADVAKPALLEALQTADEIDRPHLVWALVVLGEPQIVVPALDLWQSGKLSGLERLDGTPAFDPGLVGRLPPPDDFSRIEREQSRTGRALLASAFPDSVSRPTLLSLLEDPDLGVAAPAAAALTRAGDDQARRAVLEALRAARGSRKLGLLHALRDGVGGEGLVLALDAVAEQPEQQWFEYQRIFRMLQQLADPRIGDPLSRWLERRGSEVSLHWQAEAALRLAEVADLRAVPLLGRRMEVDSAELYDPASRWQTGPNGHLSKDDRQRIQAAKLLADLAIIYPRERPSLALQAAEPTLRWLQSRLLPHSDGLRFVAAVRHEGSREQLRSWAFPESSLAFAATRSALPRKIEVAPAALRSIGAMGDHPSVPKLLATFDGKPRGLDISRRGAAAPRRSRLGLDLRGVGRGAADGLSLLGRLAGPEAARRLTQIARDTEWHQDVRLAACRALADVGAESLLDGLVDEIRSAAPVDELAARCFAETLARGASRERVEALVGLLQEDLPRPVHMAVGRAIGRCGLGWDRRGFEAERLLVELLREPERGNAAVLALLLGGSRDAAVRAALVLTRVGTEDRRAIRQAYGQATDLISERALARGTIYRWVENAQAIARIPDRTGRRQWALELLGRQLRSVDLAAGPHGLSRPVLRHRLLAAAEARGSEAPVHTLALMGEQGALMALAAEGGDLGALATQLLPRGTLSRSD